MKTSNIRGFPGYCVTKHGKVYRKCSGKWSLLPIKKWGNNYVVNLTNSYKRRTFIVARLVAMTYIPNPENKPCVCHKDNDKSNNYYKNLYWVHIRRIWNKKLEMVGLELYQGLES